MLDGGSTRRSGGGGGEGERGHGQTNKKRPGVYKQAELQVHGHKISSILLNWYIRLKLMTSHGEILFLPY